MKPFVRDLMSPQVLSSDFMKVLSTKGHYVSNIRVIDKKNRYKRKSQIESSDSDEWFLVTLFCMEFFPPLILFTEKFLFFRQYMVLSIARTLLSMLEEAFSP